MAIAIFLNSHFTSDVINVTKVLSIVLVCILYCDEGLRTAYTVIFRYERYVPMLTWFTILVAAS